MGAVYLFHDLYGYLMEMSPDIADMIEAFGGGVDTEETIAYYAGKFGKPVGHSLFQTGRLEPQLRGY